MTVAAHSLRTMDATSSARWADTLAVFDLETTGSVVDTCRIVTAHVGVIDGFPASADPDALF